MAAIILLTPLNTRRSEKHQRGKNFLNFGYKNNEEKNLFNKARNYELELV